MRASILEVRPSGLILRLNGKPGNPEAWLPSGDWSINPLLWDAASISLEPGSEIDVASIPMRLEGRQVVSRRAFSRDALDSSWINEIREITISDIGRTLIRGTIGDCIPGVVSRESYLDWVASKGLSQDWSDHGELAQGDVIRGFVRSIANKEGAVELDVSGYLDYRSNETTKAVQSTIAHPLEEREERSVSTLQMLSREVSDAISPVLLADDNDKCRESVASLFRRARVDVQTLGNIDDAKAFLSAFDQKNHASPMSKRFRLAILDPNLEEESFDLTGLKIAEALASLPNCRIVLMTGEASNEKKLKYWSELKIHGYIEKPFTANRLLEEIREAQVLKEPFPLKNWIKTQPQPIVASQALDNPATTDDGTEVPLATILQTLGKIKPNTVIHLFYLHPRSLRARSLAHFGEGLRWELLRGKIAKSVIRDTAFSREPSVEANAKARPWHLWTQQMMEYESFCGVPVHVKGQRLALVAFHRNVNAFDDSFVVAARLAAERTARALERQLLRDSRSNEATFVSFGMALASLAHELASEMTALDASLKELSDVLSGENDVDSQSDSMHVMESIRADVADIAQKTAILRSIHTRVGTASIPYCLKKASAACRKLLPENFKHPERIYIAPVETPPGLWEVAVPPASLIIIFFNLYLNAAQQIDLASRVRKFGEIWQSVNRYTDSTGRSWARVRIHDSGPGIHHEDWERVFEPGYSTKPNGSGLGLYICRHLLQGISGNILVTSSAIWDGTTFTVNLPLTSSK